MKQDESKVAHNRKIGWIHKYGPFLSAVRNHLTGAWRSNVRKLGILQPFIHLGENQVSQMFIFRCSGIFSSTHDGQEFVRGFPTCIGRRTKEKTIGHLYHAKLTGCFGKIQLDVL